MESHRISAQTEEKKNKNKNICIQTFILVIRDLCFSQSYASIFNFCCWRDPFSEAGIPDFNIWIQEESISFFLSDILAVGSQSRAFDVTFWWENKSSETSEVLGWN